VSGAVDDVLGDSDRLSGLRVGVDGGQQGVGTDEDAGAADELGGRGCYLIHHAITGRWAVALRRLGVH